MAEQTPKARPDGQFDPRDIQAKNVAGSTAGAGSGDFHVYRHQRRIELDRIAKMEKEAREKEESEQLFRAAEERRLKEVNKTLKRASKRKRKKVLRGNRKKLRPAVEAVQPGLIVSDKAAYQNQSDVASADNPQENGGASDEHILKASDNVTREENQPAESDELKRNDLDGTGVVRGILDTKDRLPQSEQPDAA